MEHFEGRQGNVDVKEKSIYTLHLDTPRIIIVASIVLGLVAVSFLVGMNLLKDNAVQTTNMTASELIASGASQNIMEPRDNTEAALIKDQSSALLGDKLIFPDAENLSAKKNEPITVNEPVNVSEANTKTILPSAIPNVVSEPKNIEPAKKAKKDKIAKVAKTSTKDAPAKDTAKTEKPKKKKTVATKAETKSNSTVQPVASSKIQSGSFAIQIASYDQRSKAVSEIENLKNLSYNAYLDNTSVDGKQFFRVRIGPLLSREKASVILDELHENSRYSDSYIVKQ